MNYLIKCCAGYMHYYDMYLLASLCNYTTMIIPSVTNDYHHAGLHNIMWLCLQDLWCRHIIIILLWYLHVGHVHHDDLHCIRAVWK